MEVSLEEAYAEACRALGESIVRERLITKRIDLQQAAVQNGDLG
ncbi:hypothetical protein J2X01_002460 [Arthrobacter ginsengisoli]|uniref:Fumarate hydratase n=1 Tax=Arthrobacter ginsengisoli TaxID=1356565 RepID=A0ABU1UD95_9MICC|nr:hypothetical protein [Arthrobacter ginsengisoli]